MDLLGCIIYTLKRFGIMLILVVIGCFMGVVALPALASVFPGSARGVKDFLTNPNVGSVLCLAIVTGMMTKIFYNDGRKHTAYEEWEGYTVAAIQLVIGMAYVIPAAFGSSFAQEGRAGLFFKVLYYPARWLYSGLSAELSVGALAVALLNFVFCCVSYIAAYKIYTKRHPLINLDRDSE